jgi:ABC-type phosphate/phosphonate transport system substrate-binding protein
MQPYSNENLLPKTARLQADLANETEKKVVLTVTSALNAVIQAYEGS